MSIITELALRKIAAESTQSFRDMGRGTLAGAIGAFPNLPSQIRGWRGLPQDQAPAAPAKPATAPEKTPWYKRISPGDVRSFSPTNRPAAQQQEQGYEQNAPSTYDKRALNNNMDRHPGSFRPRGFSVNNLGGNTVAGAYGFGEAVDRRKKLYDQYGLNS